MQTLKTQIIEKNRRFFVSGYVVSFLLFAALLVSIPIHQVEAATIDPPQPAACNAPSNSCMDGNVYIQDFCCPNGGSMTNQCGDGSPSGQGCDPGYLGTRTWNCLDGSWENGGQTACGGGGGGEIFGNCGTADNTFRSTIPSTSSEKCSSGNATTVQLIGGRWLWSCMGAPIGAGNDESCEVKQDITAPSGTIAATASPTNNPYAPSGNITGTATDNVSGVKDVHIALIDMSNVNFTNTRMVKSVPFNYASPTLNTTWSYPITGFALTSGKTYQLHTAVIDHAGNNSGWIFQVQFLYDTQTPTCTVTPASPAPYAEYLDVQDFTINCTETGGSGFAYTRFGIDGGAPISFGSNPTNRTTTIRIPVGTHSLQTYTQDLAGNASSTNQNNIRVISSILATRINVGGSRVECARGYGFLVSLEQDFLIRSDNPNFPNNSSCAPSNLYFQGISSTASVTFGDGTPVGAVSFGNIDAIRTGSTCTKQWNNATMGGCSIYENAPGGWCGSLHHDYGGSAVTFNAVGMGSSSVGNTVFYNYPVSIPACAPTAACGTANNGMFVDAPTTNLCSAGAPSAVTATGDLRPGWQWNCGGVAACTANRNLLRNVTFNMLSCNQAEVMVQVAMPALTFWPKLKGVSFDGGLNYSDCTICDTDPGGSACYNCERDVVSLNLQPVGGSVNYDTSRVKMKDRANNVYDNQNPEILQIGPRYACPVPASCGGYSQTYTESATGYSGGSYCSVGSPLSTPPFPAAGNEATWICDGPGAGADATCVAQHTLNGSCNPAFNGQNLAGPPTTAVQMCNKYDPANPPSVLTLGGNTPAWQWICNGKYSGTNATCTANKRVNAVCGNSSATYTAPTAVSPLCQAGTFTTASAVTDTGTTFTWSCTGINGGNPASCTAPKKVDCQVSAWSGYAHPNNIPDGAGGTCSLACGTGTQSRTRAVTVNPLNGGNACPTLSESRSCNTTLCPVNGACGTANNTTYLAAEAFPNGKTYCVAGTGTPSPNPPANPTFQTPSSWTCSGLNGGLPSGTCRAERARCDMTTTITSPLTAVTINQGDNQSFAGTGLCNGAFCGTTSHTWTSGDGQTANVGSTSFTYNNAGTFTATLSADNGECSDTKQVTVSVIGTSCGTAHTTNLSTAPSTKAELCSVGSSATISNPASPNWTWNWSCTGGSTTVQCYANQVINGACGPARKNYAEADTGFIGGPTGFCSSPTQPSSTPAFPPAGSSVTWTCAPLNGGTPATCTANHSLNGVCGNAQGKTYSSTANAYAPDVQCSRGTPSNTTFPSSGSSLFWNCGGALGGTSSTCAAVCKLQAIASASPMSPNTTQFVSFTGVANGTSCGAAPTTFAWNFGDGSPIDTNTNPTHKYKNSGSYTVTLTVSKTVGAVTSTATATIVINVQSIAVPTCSFDPESPITLQRGLMVAWLEACGKTYGTFMDTAQVIDHDPSHDLISNLRSMPVLTITTDSVSGFIEKLSLPTSATNVASSKPWGAGGRVIKEMNRRFQTDYCPQLDENIIQTVKQNLHLDLKPLDLGTANDCS